MHNKKTLGPQIQVFFVIYIDKVGKHLEKPNL